MLSNSKDLIISFKRKWERKKGRKERREGTKGAGWWKGGRERASTRMNSMNESFAFFFILIHGNIP